MINLESVAKGSGPINVFRSESGRYLTYGCRYVYVSIFTNFKFYKPILEYFIVFLAIFSPDSIDLTQIRENFEILYRLMKAV